MPRFGRPLRTTAAISASVRVAIRVTMPGANSPPFASSPWHIAQRVSKTCLPGPGVWAVRVAADAITSSHGFEKRISEQCIDDPYGFYTRTEIKGTPVSMNRILLLLVTGGLAFGQDWPVYGGDAGGT